MSPFPVPEPAPRRNADALDDYLGPLTESERALMSLIQDLSRKTGFCYAGQSFLADRLDLSARQIRRLLRSLHEKGCLAISFRRGAKLRLKVLRDAPLSVKAVSESARDPGHPCPIPPDIHVLPGADIHVLPTAHSINTDSVFRVAGAAKQNSTASEKELEAAPLFARRTYFNVFRPRYQGDWMTLEKRICDAINREKRILYVLHQGRERVIAKASYGTGGVFLDLLSEGIADGSATERIAIPLRELGNTKFWR